MLIQIFAIFLASSIAVVKSDDVGQCCLPEFLFLIDIAEHTGFSYLEGEQHVEPFISKIVTRNANNATCDVRAAVIEYATSARIRCDFNKHTPVAVLLDAIRNYAPAGSLGSTSNATKPFIGALRLIAPQRGHRLTSPVNIIWLVRTTPTDMDTLAVVVNELKANVKNQIIVIAIGNNVDQAKIAPIASSSDLFFQVAKSEDLPQQVDQLTVNYCPDSTTQEEIILKMRRPSSHEHHHHHTTQTAETTQPAPAPTNPPQTTARRRRTRRTPAPETTTVATTVAATTRRRRTTTLPPAPAPTIPVLSFEPVPADDMCFQCRMRRNPKDLFADGSECHHYYQCFYLNESSAFGIRRVCPAGTFWHDAVLQCMPEGEIPCVDRCMDDAVAAKGCYAGNSCSSFFVCSNTASYGMCCSPGTRFNDLLCSCDEDPTCTDICVQTGPVIPTAVAPSSQFNSSVCQDSWGTYIMAAPGVANAFILIDSEGQPTERMPCPAGTSFNLATCTCSEYDENAVPLEAARWRRAILWIPFDSDTLDHSTFKYTTFLYNGAERDATAFAYGGGSLFVNKGHVSIPGLKSFDMRDSGSWCAFFRCESDNGYNCVSSGGILSNNKDGTSTEYTIILASQASNRITGRLDFWRPVGAMSVNSQISSTPSNGWNHVCVTYDSNTVRLYLNGAVADIQNVGGYLSIAHCPFVIGHDQGFGYFTGHIDDVLITPFAMTDEEVTAHRTGDRNYLANVGFW